jgi:LacI family transcriptional regulator
MPRVRIKDIAKIANVSTGTVDRVLHNRKGVSENTRELIQSILEEHDYQPDILAGTLASGKEYHFLVCMPEVVNVHEFWKFPEMGVQKALSEMQHFGITVDFLRFDQHNKKDFENKTKSLLLSKYDGLLFAPVFSQKSFDFVKSWQESGKPCVQFNSRVEGAETDGFIGQDAFQSGFLGGKLISYGLPAGKDVLIVNLSLREDNYQHILKRERGFRSFYEEHNERIRNLITLNLSGGSYESVEKELEKCFQSYDIAGIFVTNSRVHLVAKFLANRGIMNIRLVGYDLIKESIEYLRREYIDFLISQSPEEQAYLGLKQLFNLVVLRKPIQNEIYLPIDILTKENIDYYLKFNVQNE